MAKHLEDIGKDAKDLLSQDFPSDGTIKLSSETKNSENVTIKTTLNRYIKKEKISREIISATYEEKLEDKAHNLQLSAKITTNSEYSGTIILEDLFVFGSKFEMNINRTSDSLSVSPLFIYKKDNLAFKGKMAYPVLGKKSPPIKFFTDAGFMYSSLLGGIGTTIALESPKTSIDVEGVLAYADTNHQITARVKHTLQSSLVNLGLSYYYLYNPKFPIALDINTNTAFDKLSLAIIGKKKIDKFTTVKGKTVLKHSKKETEIRGGLSLKQQICSCLWATFGGNLNLTKFLGNDLGEPHSFGVEFKFTQK